MGTGVIEPHDRALESPILVRLVTFSFYLSQQVES